MSIQFHYGLQQQETESAAQPSNLNATQRMCAWVCLQGRRVVSAIPQCLLDTSATLAAISGWTKERLLSVPNRDRLLPQPRTRTVGVFLHIHSESHYKHKLGRRRLPQSSSLKFTLTITKSVHCWHTCSCTAYLQLKLRGLDCAKQAWILCDFVKKLFLNLKDV